MEDALAACELGADAVGFVFYPRSPRYLNIERAREIVRHIAPFVTIVGLFVNQERAITQRIIDALPLQLLQFHGDETEPHCAHFGLPYIKAVRVRPDFDLIEYAGFYPSAQALLLDAFVEGYGGSGRMFDWSLIPRGLPLPLILAGGLTPSNVATAVRTIRPWAVDCSSGVEVAPGVKDARKIADFIAEVKNGDV